MKGFKRILVPTDYSELSISAMDCALLFSKMFGARIHLLHTLDTIPVLALQAVDLTTEAVISETERNARNDLHMFAVSKIGNIPDLVEVVRKGIAEEEIVKFAKEEDIDLIIMATHGRSVFVARLDGECSRKSNSAVTGSRPRCQPDQDAAGHAINGFGQRTSRIGLTPNTRIPLFATIVVHQIHPCVTRGAEKISGVEYIRSHGITKPNVTNYAMAKRVSIEAVLC